MPFKILRPYRIVDHITEITADFLVKRGITTVLLDLDNTLTRWNSNQLDEIVIDWIKSLKEAKINPCIVSNNKKSRIENVALQLDIPYIFRAAKPRKGAYRKALEVMQAQPEKTAFIGDQLFTDVFGANRMRLYSVLVKPLHPREFAGTKVMRRFEKLVMRHIKPKELI